MNMESNEKPIINRIKVVLVEQRRTNKWLADTLGKDCTTVSKWCTNRRWGGGNSVVNQFITDDYIVQVSKFLINNLPQRLFVLVEKVG